MLHESFTARTRAPDGRVVFTLERVGRAQLGVWCWRFMSSLTEPMLPPERAAWAKLLSCAAAKTIEEYSPAWAKVLRQESASKAIMAYAEARGETVDAAKVLGALKNSKLMGDGPWN